MNTLHQKKLTICCAALVALWAGAVNAQTAPVDPAPYVACVQKQLVALGHDPGDAEGKLGRPTTDAWTAVLQDPAHDRPAHFATLPTLTEQTAVIWCRELPDLDQALVQHMPAERPVVIHVRSRRARQTLADIDVRVRQFFEEQLSLRLAVPPGIVAGSDPDDLNLLARRALRDLGYGRRRFLGLTREMCGDGGAYSARAVPGMFLICWEAQNFGARWAKRTRHWLEPLYAHEYMHLWQAEASGEFALTKWHPTEWGHDDPLWLSEGVAELIAERYAAHELGQEVLSTEQLRRKARKEDISLTDLRKPERSFHPEEYVLAQYAARVLVEEHGLEVVLGYWRGLGSGLAWQAAFQQSFGTDILTFENRITAQLEPLRTGPRGPKDPGKDKKK